MKELVIPTKYHNKKLNTFLLDTFPCLKMSTLQKTLRKKDIRINDKRISENIILQAGDHLKVFIDDTLLTEPSTFQLDIVYEDENLLVLNKPTHIEVVNSKEGISLADHVKKYCASAEPCHRLDRNTSGLILFAKNKEALGILFAKFKEKEVEKHYLAKVYGILPKKQARLEDYLFKDTKKSLVYISALPKTGYQKIITSYHVLGENKKENTSLLDVMIETGRTHQIRAHLAYLRISYYRRPANMAKMKSIKLFMKRHSYYVLIVLNFVLRVILVFYLT